MPLFSGRAAAASMLAPPTAEDYDFELLLMPVHHRAFPRDSGMLATSPAAISSYQSLDLAIALRMAVELV